MRFLFSLAAITLLIQATCAFSILGDAITLRDGEITAQQRLVIPLSSLKVKQSYTITCMIEDRNADNLIQVFALDTNAGAISINDQPAGYEFAQVPLVAHKNKLIIDNVMIKKVKANLIIANISTGADKLLQITNCRAVSN